MVTDAGDQQPQLPYRRYRFVPAGYRSVYIAEQLADYFRSRGKMSISPSHAGKTQT